tara:strand:+ start:195 stop:1205 length:1011 start_codon:yes stop_codon:yes gene_type:complete
MDRTAQGIASKGRFGDTTLVHMSPDEVQGIEQLAGMPTTTNPDTGLPEMFSFRKFIGKTGRRILPAVGSAAGFIMSGGNPYAAAAGSALGTKLAGGSTQDALTSGLVTGVTAGLANKIPGFKEAAGIGTEAAKEGVKAGAYTALPQYGVGQVAKDAATQEIQRTLGQQAMLGGVGALAGEAGRAFGSTGMEAPKKPDIPGLPDVDPMRRRVAYPGEDFGSQEFRYFNPNNLYAREGGHIKQMQEGGIASIPQTEGQVEGKGDGMSDEVYGDIEDQQEVALSKDEFIVPADVVAGLGNGSSNAGASKLYEMMERVRMARTGKKTQPKEIEAEEFLPA